MTKLNPLNVPGLGLGTKGLPTAQVSRPPPTYGPTPTGIDSQR